MDQQQDDRVVVIGTNKLQMLHKFGAFYVKDGDLAFYIGKNSDIQIPGKTLTDANRFFTGKMLRSALRELDAYLMEHINDREMYRSEPFWKDALKYAGRTIMPHVFWIDFRPVPYGYFFIHTADCRWSCSHNFTDDTYTLKCSEKNSDEALTLVEFCYHGLLDQLLAQRHAENGTAPEAYVELTRMNRFLRDKRSVHCVFKDGKIFQSFSRDPFRADCLINEVHGKFVINPHGYREVPGKDAGLPVMLRHYITEFPLSPNAFENLDIEIDDPRVREAKEKENLLKKIVGMIPSGSWFPFCKVELKTYEGHSHTFFHPSNPDTRDSLLKLDEVNDFLHKYCDKTELTALFVNYCIGIGGPAPMPDEVFALLIRLGHWRWHELPGFGESPVHTTEFDTGFLYDYLYGKDVVSWEKECSLLRRKILASIPEGVSYDFSVVQVMGESCKTEEAVSGDICDEDSARELPFFRAFSQEHQEESEFYVVSRCFHAGEGASEDMPEHLLVLIKEYGVENFAQESIVRVDRPKEFHSLLPERTDDDDAYDSGIATELMPQSVRKKLLKSRLYSKDKQGKSAEVVVKYFNPCGAGTWLITEGEEQKNGDWLLFGMCHIFD